MAKILVIDDERSIRNSMKDILSFEGHEVVLAENGMEGLVSVKTENRRWCSVISKCLKWKESRYWNESKNLLPMCRSS